MSKMNNENWGEANDCFWELYNSWGKDERKHYCECYEVDENPDDIPTDLLQPHHYKCLRVLEDYFKPVTNLHQSSLFKKGEE